MILKFSMPLFPHIRLSNAFIFSFTINPLLSSSSSTCTLLCRPLDLYQRNRQFPHTHHRYCVTSSARPAITSTAEPRTLYIVATPIGNPFDVTLRARDILRSVDVIAAEDTRVTSALLSALSVERPTSQQLVSCHAHNFRARIPMLLERLVDGASVALVTDAGTPCIQDPGFEIVEAATAAGIRVTPIPGASAALAAIAASALPCETFTFIGFLPRTSSARQQAIEEVAATTHAVILYEAPHRLCATLADLAGNKSTKKRAICIGRELTKKWEQFLRFDNLSRARDHFDSVKPRGEFTLVLAASPPEPARRGSLADYKDTKMDVIHLVDALVRDGVPVSTISKILAASSDIPKKILYAHAIDTKNRLADTVQNTIDPS